MSAVGDARKRAQEKASTPDDRDALGLMRTLAPVVEHRRNYGLKAEDAEVYARAILVSDWLAEHDRQVAAKALREVAAWAAGNAVGRVSTAYLRDRANQIEGGGEDA